MKDLRTFDCNDVSTTEVELTAEDLAGLSPSTAVEQPRTLNQRPAAVGAIAQATQKPTAPPASKRPAVPSRNLFLTLGVAITAIAAIGVQYRYATLQGAIPSSSLPASPEAGHLARAEFLPDPAQPPTHFANPFDPTEVFEFPSGTSEADMRAAVAEFLLERARLREAQLHARR